MPPAKYAGKNGIRIRADNLINNNDDMPTPSGLLGPVTLRPAEKDKP